MGSIRRPAEKGREITKAKTPWQNVEKPTDGDMWTWEVVGKHTVKLKQFTTLFFFLEKRNKVERYVLNNENKLSRAGLLCVCVLFVCVVLLCF